MTEQDKGNGNFWLGFFLGGLIGAFIIYLLGTKEGKKALEKIINQAEIYEEEIEEKVALLQQKGEDFLKEAEGVKEKVVKKISNTEQKISDQLANKMDEALTKIEDIQKKGVAITSEVHHHYFKKNGKKLAA